MCGHDLSEKRMETSSRRAAVSSSVRTDLSTIFTAYWWDGVDLWVHSLTVEKAPSPSCEIDT
jgi:hypothetical protein